MTVLDRTKIVDGVEARVVHDVVTEEGKLVEDTYDWYSQDAEGNVWYVGEATKEYDEGKLVGTRGLVGGGRRRRPGRNRHAGRRPRSEWSTGRSTTRARPRTRARCSAWTRVDVPAGSYKPC